MSAGTTALVLGAILLLSALLGYNRLVTLRNRVQSAWADIDVQLTRRHQLIPNLVETVKAYAAHEQSLLEEVTRARTEGVAAASPAQQAIAEQQLDNALGRVLLLAEAYPELKADERFRALQDELVATENKIAFSRQLYNDTVNAYRDATQSFPLLLLARPFGFRAPEFFAVPDAERGVTDVSFDGRG